ncbi:MAG TPA: S49 family peptidase [Alphaproteobacteria bacterium]|nr:S49 family peptidase [Alphaproteobacteria bacterium]
MSLTAFLDRLPIPALRPALPQVSVVRLFGVIGPLGPLRGGLNIAGVAGVLERAFKIKPLSAVALAINSPGGSASQSLLIAGRIRQLAAEKNVPVFAFVEDVAASGGYWLACAADEIYAAETSIVGSIGVISTGFGFQDLIKRLGIRRRLYTAGERKAMLDPFLAEDPDDIERLKALQHELHEAFKTQVRTRRANKLKASEDALFNGEFWTGRRALEFGLVDGIGDLRGTLRNRFGDKVRLRVVSGERGWLRRRLGLATVDAPAFAWPADWAPELIASLEARALWSRFGL